MKKAKFIKGMISTVLATGLMLSCVTGCGASEGNSAGEDITENVSDNAAENASESSTNNAGEDVAENLSEAAADNATEAIGDNTAEKTKEAAEENTGEKSADSKGATDSSDLAALSSKEYAVIMGNGINLGNTMEACDSTRPGDYINNDIAYFETLWGQPVTTQKHLEDMKASGLDTVRIPVAWHNAMDFTNGDYTIRPEYLERVKEIVDYAYAADLYVVINDHWDSGWWGLFGATDAARREAAMTQYVSMWEQISDYFKDYDYRLVFEGGNEEIGDRLNDIDATFNPDGAALSKDECYSKANEINQTFVDTVRKSGGNNADRFLLIPGYGTDITQTLDARWHMPDDTATDKLFLSVHYYTPWSYCGSTGASTWGTKKNYEEMNTLLSGLYDKYGKDYGIIIGECGVLPTSSGEAKPNTLLWYKNFFANCDKYGYVPLLWNTGDILKKADGSWYSDEIKTFLEEKSYENEAAKSADEIIAEADKVMADGIAAAPETFQTEDKLAGDGKAVAWIMWDSQDWNIVYSVGDTYDPDSSTAGIEATDVEINGEGTYTVGLDFTGTDAGASVSTAFSAIGIANGEELFPGYIITIKQVLINGEEYKLHGRNYTSSDDGLCTRTNLYNEWVSKVPDDARTAAGGLNGCKPSIFDQSDLGSIETLEITFDYTPGEEGISPNDANSKN